MINNVVLVSGVQQSDSVMHIHVAILFQILFPFRLLQSIEQSSLCYTVGPCWLSILNIVVCTCQAQTPNVLFCVWFLERILMFPYVVVTTSTSFLFIAEWDCSL